jgi:hypothetical protein
VVAERRPEHLGLKAYPRPRPVQGHADRHWRLLSTELLTPTA